ncbi:SulP family sulfate permease [Amaricoccus macauensis]|uniref:SulP family sulfate permease n=1 Tax=Amaricoccus macauensis TaxID=57001 RepID=A0A840SNU9_9RHOB|nr:SulP family inorganic anion transporter [Amaricoccus macauensis]MBB5221083.1 SulP family sulfate permease [Amaricoccus macauensis]
MDRTYQERAPFLPKLVTTLAEGYGRPQLKADLLAGLTVAIVALPLSMAIAIASGVAPERGLYTAIIGGFLVSALGGSRFQIGGPAGAFIVLVAATVTAHGLEGMLLATLLSGVMLAAAGLLRLGTFVKFIPYPVTVGFTAGIAALIFASQIVPLLGLHLAGAEPGPLVEKLPALWAALPSVNLATVALSLACIVALVALKLARPQWPRMLVVVAVAAVAVWATGLDVATIGSAFGGIPDGLPVPSLPPVSITKVIDVLPAAFAFALLGSIESLLSAVVADGMTGRRHRSNTELVAQGIANVASALCGGICVTGTIARTATNVRAGAYSPIAGMSHSVFLLIFILVAAPLAAYVPLAALAAVLALVCYDMVEKPAFAALLRSSWGDATVLLVTLGLTLFRDLSEAIVVGFSLGAVLFIHRMSKSVEVEKGPHDPYRLEDGADPEAVIFRVTGAMFFGAVSAVGAALDRIDDHHRILIVDLAGVTLVDSSAANMLEGLAHKAKRRGVSVYLTGARQDLRRELLTHGLRRPLVRYAESIEAGLATARRRGELGPGKFTGAVAG